MDRPRDDTGPTPHASAVTVAADDGSQAESDGLARIVRLARRVLDDAPAQLCVVRADQVRVLRASPFDLPPPPLRIAQQLATAEGTTAATDRDGTTWLGAPAGPGGRAERLVLCAPTQVDGGRVRAAIADLAALAAGITRLRQTTGELAAMRGLLGIATHDLRNPLSVLQAALETMVNHGDELPIDQADMIGALAIRQAHRMATLIDGLLAAHGVEEGEAFEDVDLVTLVDDALEGGRLVHQLVELRRTGALPLDPVLVHGTPDALARLVANLVTNAAVHGGGHVWLGLATEHDTAFLIIEDDGPGLPRESALDEDGERKHRPGGHGLGLLIARRIVEAHNGTITHTDRPGGGTRIEVALPRSDR